ncbi:hypothetical protein LY78DRAFT_656223 [Colletotrichum sublineola]|nr:hypothetical protein LY78DRAFT_656223 [Colletotrichum sublineola]
MGKDTKADFCPVTNRFGASSLHQRDSRSALFEGYTGDNNRRPVSASPSRLSGGYGYGYAGSSASPAPPMGGSHLGVDGGRGFRPATPNKRYEHTALKGGGQFGAVVTIVTSERGGLVRERVC